MLVGAALATGSVTRWTQAFHLALPNRDQKYNQPGYLGIFGSAYNASAQPLTVWR